MKNKLLYLIIFIGMILNYYMMWNDILYARITITSYTLALLYCLWVFNKEIL